MSQCYINGSYEHIANARISVEDRGFNFSDGVYEVIKFKSKILLNYDKHILRLKRSLKELKIISPFSNIISLKIIIKNLIHTNNLEHGFIYLQITRGTAKRNHLFPEQSKPNVVIFSFPDKDLINLRKGVKIGLIKDKRWLRCDIKSISLLPNVLDKQSGFEQGFFEVWQVRNNLITEGTTSNAFIVKNKRIFTHPKNNFILGGVTRDCVVKIAKENKIDIQEKAFNSKEISHIEEAFLTSTTLGIIPVTQIDDFIINKKKVGKITKQLTSKFNIFINSQSNI